MMDEQNHIREPRGRRFGLGTLVLAIVLTAVLTFGATTYGLRGALVSNPKELTLAAELQRQPNYAKLIDVINKIQQFYYQAPSGADQVKTEEAARGKLPSKPNLNQLLEGAIEGSVASLKDPYSVYFDTSQWKEFGIDFSGEYSGIGVMVTEKKAADGKTYITVVRTFPGAPANITPYENAPAGAETGLKPGDRILSVNGRDVVNVPSELAAQLIRGAADTQVEIKVQRGEAESAKTLTFRITRKKIIEPLVNHKMLPGQIGYIQLVQFSGAATDQFRGALDDLLKQGMKGLVFDLRDDPGGDLKVAQDIGSMLLPKGPLTTLVYNNGARDTYASSGPGLNVPMAVLINGYTASASEIMAGAIQDSGKGVLVGTQSFGKGVVQRIWPYNDKTGVKLTVGMWFTPKGRSINKTGLTPDLKVEPGKNVNIGQPDPLTDPQLRAALKYLGSK